MEKDKLNSLGQGPAYASSQTIRQDTEALVRILTHWRAGEGYYEVTQRTQNAFNKFLETQRQQEQLKAEVKRVRVEELTKQLHSVKKYHEFLSGISQQAADEFAKFYISSILEEYIEATVEETLESAVSKIADLVTKALLK